MFSQDDYEALINFFYQIPFGVARMDENGEMTLSNPKTVQLMLQLNPGSTNLYETLREAAPQVESLVRAYSKNKGVIIDEAFVNLGKRHPRQKLPLVIVLSISKMAQGWYMLVISDASQRAFASGHELPAGFIEQDKLQLSLSA